MVLVIDAGNTNVVVALIKDGETVHVIRHKTVKEDISDYYYQMLSSFIAQTDDKMDGSLHKNIEGTVISSVVPEINEWLADAVRHCLGHEPMFVSHKLNSGIDIKYDDPSKLGADLIAGAAGAVKKFGCPVIMIDIGTATTFSVVNAQGEYLGGMIAPGPYTALDALTSVASQLPSGELPIIDEVIGTNTRDCMSIGAFTAHAAMIDGMLDRVIASQNFKDYVIVATGGPARDITAMCTHEIICDRDIVLFGMYVIFGEN